MPDSLDGTSPTVMPATPKGVTVYLRGKEKAVRILTPGTLRLRKCYRDGHIGVELNGVEIAGFERVPGNPIEGT